VSEIQTRLIGFTKLLLSLVAICFGGASAGGIVRVAHYGYSEKQSQDQLRSDRFVEGGTLDVDAFRQQNGLPCEETDIVGRGWPAFNRQMFESTIAGGDSLRALGRPW
jgi:hypothetical protein